MFIKNCLEIYLIGILLHHIAGLSFNQPKFCPFATWNPNAITVANESTIGYNPDGIFVDLNNTIYIPNRDNGKIYIWSDHSTNLTKIIQGDLSIPIRATFVTTNGDIYVDNGENNHRVDKWTSSTNIWTSVMYVYGSCFGLFVDINNTIYCSMCYHHQVVKTWLNIDTNTTSIAAGTGIADSASNTLTCPYGIFVDSNFDLYVADCNNDRIQLFRAGQLNGTTVAGNGLLSTTIILLKPTGIVLDADRYLFIVDSDNNRIVGSGPDGFRCIVGCSKLDSSSSDQLHTPLSLSFDSYGNIFVSDQFNNRVQKFLLEDHFCDATTDSPTTMKITTTTTSKLPIIDPTCSSPEIKLIPEAFSPSSPLQFRRSQDFYILSAIKLKCNKSLSKTTKWIIKNYTTTDFYDIPMDKKIISTNSELFIPANTLPYGIYQFTLIVSMTIDPSRTNSSSTYIRISSSGITANLVQLGTSVVTSGYQQNLTLDPGNFSMDSDGYPFNASDWIYQYSCRVYGIDGPILPLDSCLSDPQGKWIYNGVKLSPKSSITILAGSLQLNKKYQFLVQMSNRRNVILQASGYVLVQIEDSNRPMIAIGCVIWSLCAQNLEFQRVNPTTQVALYSRCVEKCTEMRNITWKIYHGEINSNWNFTKWTLFDRDANEWFFGKNTSNFTAIHDLFLTNPNETLWKFEVVYTFQSISSSSALNFIINPPPSNGTCQMNPQNGNTSTIFHVTCSDWYNKDNIKDYSLYTWKTDRSNLIIIAFSPIPTFEVQLPADDDLSLVIHVRDLLDGITEWNISSITVQLDFASNLELINTFRQSEDEMENNELIQLLSSGNQNQIGQVIRSLSEVFDQINNETLEKAISNGIPLTSISISSLGSPSIEQDSKPLNQSALLEYNREINFQANLREYFIHFTDDLSITSPNSIKLQSLALVQLTRATNQLTRTTLMIASENCYRLTRSLHSSQRNIPYEDVRIAGTQLLQCASNVLTAVNAPLQERASVLELDSSRATNFPEDYDTDLELDWTNPNFFSDGNDFSWETLQKGRIVYYQRQLADQITTKMTEMISLLTATLNIHLNVRQNLTVNTSAVFMSLETITAQALANKMIKQVGEARIDIPVNFSSNVNPNQTISIRSMMEPLASYGKSRLQLHTNLSRSVSLTILQRDGTEIPLRTSIHSPPIEIIIPRDPNSIIPPMILHNITSLPHNQSFYFDHVNITSILPISVHFEIEPLISNRSYLFIYKFDQYPLLNSSIAHIDGWTLLCPVNLTNEGIYRYFLTNQDTLAHQNITFGLRELNSTEYCSNISMDTLPPINEQLELSSNYKLRIYTSGCYYLDSNKQWKSEGVTVGPLTNLHQTQCFSTHLTTFTGRLDLLPESINFDYVLANLNPLKNKTIYLTVISVLTIYIILIIYARLQDRKDVEKLGVTPLSDNHPNDRYYYQILVFTGQRKDAGTKSQVHFVLSGNDHETSIRTFADPHREIFHRGGVNAFIMAVPKCLGLLNYLHIWHDNTGEGSSASWFLKYIIIQDLQTMEKFHFIAQRWFAVEKDDGKIERVLPVADEAEKNEFSYVLSKRAYHSMSEGHLWFSIFSRPPSNQFTRVQRCTCCFVLLFLSMALNIMYYGLGSEVEHISGVSLALGPFLVTLQQVVIGIIIEFISLLSSLLLVQFFRRIRSRQHRISPLNQALMQMKSHSEVSVSKSKATFTFPWWCLLIAYGLSFLFIGISIFLIIARGIEFGDTKSQKWLTSILSGLFSSIFITQPMKVLCLAIFFAFFFRNSNDEKEYIDENPIELKHDEEYFQFSPHRSEVRADRLTKYELAEARYRRLKDVQMWLIIREALTYLCFLVFLSVIVYSNRDKHAFLQVQHLRNYFSNEKYSKISTVDEYWSWVEQDFISDLRAQSWYNRAPPRNLSGYINDKTNRLIGWTTMRQIRMQSDLCVSQTIRSICQDDYSFSSEEKQSFYPQWLTITSSKEEYSSSILNAFQYRSDGELDTYVYIGDHATYSGGGYVYEFRGNLFDLRSNLSQLHRLGWIDRKTRAILIQLSLYNPNVQLFTSVTFWIEFLSTGGIYPQVRFEPMNFVAFTSSYQLICIILYMLIIIYFMWIEFELLLELKWKYLRRFWSYVELGIIICSWTAVGVYIWRYAESKRISQLFKQTNGFTYINLQLASYVNDLLTYFYGFCCFFGTIKFLRLCRLHRRLTLFGQTLEHAGEELGSFSFMFALIFTAFVCLFYFLFVSQIAGCSSVLQTSQMLLEMTLLQFNAKELTQAAPVLGPLAFSLFILIIVFICTNIFLSIIVESFRRARTTQPNDEEMFSYIWKKFSRWTGLKQPNELERAEERDARMRSNYIN